MKTTATGKARPSDIAIFGRLLENGKAAMSPALARYVLTLGFDEAEQARMRDLASRNQEGTLPAEGREELLSFVRAGHLLALLHSKARTALKKKKVS
jgi:hypothetical protein